MRIFITGAPGFIGTHILDCFSKGSDNLFLLARNKQESAALEKRNAKIICGDLRDIAKFKKDIIRFDPQACIHLAWSGIPDYSFKMSKKNLDNSLLLINFLAEQTRCKKIVISGTCFEYGKNKGKCLESDQINIKSVFAWAKYSLYSYAKLISEESAIDLIWFRLFYVYGPRQRKKALIPALVHSFVDMKGPVINNPFNANDFIHVKDVARAFWAAVHRKIKPGIYNLGSGKATKVITVCKIVKKNIPGINFPIGIRIHGARFKQAVNFCADIHKAKRSFSWRPQISIEDGIREYIKGELSR